MTTEPWFVISVVEEPWYGVSVFAVPAVSIWAARSSRGSLRFAIVVVLLALVVTQPYFFSADIMESSLSDHDTFVWTYVGGVALLLALDAGALVAATRHRRRG